MTYISTLSGSLPASLIDFISLASFVVTLSFLELLTVFDCLAHSMTVLTQLVKLDEGDLHIREISLYSFKDSSENVRRGVVLESAGVVVWHSKVWMKELVKLIHAI